MRQCRCVHHTRVTFDATKSELRQCPDSSMKKLPPPTPERCERRLFPQNNHEKRRFVCKKRGLPEPHPGRPRRPPPLHKKNKQYRCQPVCSRKHRRVSAWRCLIYLHFCIGPIRCPLSRMAAHRKSDRRRFLSTSSRATISLSPVFS